MEPATFAAFWAVSILFILTPGLDWAYTIAAGIHGRVVLPAVTGLMVGHVAAILMVAAGLGSLFSRYPQALDALTVAGALYLLWLGAGLVRHPATPASAAGQKTDSWGQWCARGAGVSGMNPKLYLLMFALLPQFLSQDISWSVPEQVLALGCLHVPSCFLVYLIVGYTAQVVLSTRPAAARLVSRCSGGIMVLIGLGMLAEQIQAAL